MDNKQSAIFKLAIANIVVVVIAVMVISNKIEDMNGNYNNLNSNIRHMNNSINSIDNSVRRQIEEAFKKEDFKVLNFNYSFDKLDVEKQVVETSIAVELKDNIDYEDYYIIVSKDNNDTETIKIKLEDNNFLNYSGLLKASIIDNYGCYVMGENLDGKQVKISDKFNIYASKYINRRVDTRMEDYIPRKVYGGSINVRYFGDYSVKKVEVLQQHPSIRLTDEELRTSSSFNDITNQLLTKDEYSFEMKNQVFKTTRAENEVKEVREEIKRKESNINNQINEIKSVGEYYYVQSIDETQNGRPKFYIRVTFSDGIIVVK